MARQGRPRRPPSSGGMARSSRAARPTEDGPPAARARRPGSSRSGPSDEAAGSRRGRTPDRPSGSSRADFDRPRPGRAAPARRPTGTDADRPRPGRATPARRPTSTDADRPRPGRATPTRGSQRDDRPAAGMGRARQANASDSGERRRPARPAQSPGGIGRPAGVTRRSSAPPSRDAGLDATTRKWGSVARRGARALNQPAGAGPSASEVWRDAVARAGPPGRPPDRAEPDWAPEETWIEEAVPDRSEAPGNPARSPAGASSSARLRDFATGREGIASPGGGRRRVPRSVVDELSAAAGAQRGPRIAARMADATYAYEKERYQEARRVLRTLAGEVPTSAAVRELYGLVLYRTGQWAHAARQLETYRQLSGSFDQHPVLADCYRALRRYDDAEEIWDELRAASPSGDLVAEGRIVAAGSRADQGDLAGAIALLERADRRVKHPQERHLRQAYALADLYERAGDVPRARQLFSRVAAADPDAFDVRQRLRSLR